MSGDRRCRCQEVEAQIHALEHSVETWAREESPLPHNVDRLTDAVVERLRVAVITGAAGVEEVEG